MPELWVPGQDGAGLKPVVGTTFQQAREFQVLTIANDQKQVTGAALAFPHEGIAYPIKDVQQIEAIAKALTKVAATLRARQFRVAVGKN